jgi:hypothetical protein
VQEIKNLQIEVKTIHEERHTIQAQMEPLQEQAKKMLKTMETEKVGIEQEHSSSIQVLKEQFATQVVETLTKKSAQAKKQVDELAKQLQKLEKSKQRAHTA